MGGVGSGRARRGLVIRWTLGRSIVCGSKADEGWLDPHITSKSVGAFSAQSVLASHTFYTHIHDGYSSACIAASITNPPPPFLLCTSRTTACHHELTGACMHVSRWRYCDWAKRVPNKRLGYQKKKHLLISVGSVVSGWKSVSVHPSSPPSRLHAALSQKKNPCPEDRPGGLACKAE